MYFNYHAKLKKMICDGKLVGFEFRQTYHNISPALLLRFDDGSVFPVREHMFDEYLFLIEKQEKK